MDISVQRIYDTTSTSRQGYRVLVDRLWPRGIGREQAQIDYWAKDITPSTELRKWFNHKPERFQGFSARYILELTNNPAFPDFMQEIKKHPKVILLYGAKDPNINHAVVLRRYIIGKL